ncbi:hypothetical protein Bp8pS_095 [Bacillus phage vB_BpuM-BpSp]|nr:hypothetical protein Bp8pS_095 [Bacillus phage vB_BpuM-BpSp]
MTILKRQVPTSEEIKEMTIKILNKTLNVLRENKDHKLKKFLSTDKVKKIRWKIKSNYTLTEDEENLLVIILERYCIGHDYGDVPIMEHEEPLFSLIKNISNIYYIIETYTNLTPLEEKSII